MPLSTIYAEIATLLCNRSGGSSCGVMWRNGCSKPCIQSGTNAACTLSYSYKEKIVGTIILLTKILCVCVCVWILFSLQNIFNSLMCLLFAIVLGLLQFRIIRDSHLPYLCYGILFFTAAFCFISMPTVGNIFPVDTKEVYMNRNNK